MSTAGSVHAFAIHALGAAHVRPHMPQFGFAVNMVSQPPPAMQSPNPLSQVVPQVPPLHSGTTCGLAHRAPHAPQFAAEVPRWTSQPLPGSPSQSPKPAAHPRMHVPPVHVAVAFEPAAHDVPQVPQFVLDAAVLVSQPLLRLPSQSANPGLHVWNMHVEIAQRVVAFGRAHVTPQAPQFVKLFSVSVSQSGVLSQFARPLVQVDSAQTPAVQTFVPPASVHGIAHAPQCRIELLVFVSQPVATIESQSANGGAHDAIEHTPARQTPTPLPTAQIRPHAPQFARSVLMSTHAPPQIVPVHVTSAPSTTVTSWMSAISARSVRSPRASVASAIAMSTSVPSPEASLRGA